jgi:hypothetical protein
MAKMTPTQEATYALAYGSSRSSLTPDAQAEYDRLMAEGDPAFALLAGVVDPLEGITTRTPPEVRERILAMFKKGNSKYAKPFDKDRLAAASFIGTQSWAEYGQVVLPMAILDTLLSIEEKLDRLTGREDEGTQDPSSALRLATALQTCVSCQVSAAGSPRWPAGQWHPA